MGSTIAILTLILMMVYIVISFTGKLSVKKVKNLIMISSIIVAACLTTSLLYRIEGNDNGFIWLFNACIWGLNIWLNKKTLKNVEKES